MAASTSATAAPNGNDAVASNGTAEKKAAKSKNALRRQKAKAKKAQGDREGSIATTGYATETDAETDHEGQAALGTPSASMEDLTIDTSDPAYAQYAAIMDKFQGTDADAEEKKVSQDVLSFPKSLTRRGCQDDGPKGAEIIYSDEEDDDEEDRENAVANAQRMSKKKRRQAAVRHATTPGPT